MNTEELIRTLEAARWKTEALYHLCNERNSPGVTNGPTSMSLEVLTEIDKALDIVLRGNE